MANTKKLKRTLAKLSDEELQDVLEFLTDDEEESQEEEQQEEQEEETKKEVKKEEEPKEEGQVIQLNKAELEELIKGITNQFVSKDELEQVKETVDKTVKKAKPFGKEQKKSKTEQEKEEIDVQSLLAKVNSQFV